MKFAVVAVLAWAVVMVSCSGGSSEPTPVADAIATATAADASTTPSVATTATGTPAPTLFGAKELSRSEPVPFPAGVVMYATDAVWEGPTAALRRYYVDETGKMRSDALYLSTWMNDDDSSRALVGVVFGTSLSEVAVALCHGSCYGGREPVTIARSSNGGITWSNVQELSSGDWGSLAGIANDAVIIRGPDADDWWTFEERAPEGSKTLPLPAGVATQAESVQRLGVGSSVVVRSEDRRFLWDLVSGTRLATDPRRMDEPVRVPVSSQQRRRNRCSAADGRPNRRQPTVVPWVSRSNKRLRFRCVPLD